MSGNRLPFVALLALAACNGAPANTNKGSETRVAPVTTTMRPAVAWPAASNIDARALEGVGSPEKVSRSPVPVLVPGDVRLTSPTLVVEGEFYSLAGGSATRRSPSRAPAPRTSTRTSRRSSPRTISVARRAS